MYKTLLQVQICKLRDNLKRMLVHTDVDGNIYKCYYIYQIYFMFPVIYENNKFYYMYIGSYISTLNDFIQKADISP